MVGFSPCHTSFSSAFCFLSKETTEDYQWALQNFKDLFADCDSLPLTITTDNEDALARAIEREFPETAHLLCRWHISKNMLVKAKRILTDKAEVDHFLSDWACLVASKTESAFDADWRARILNYPSALTSYVEKEHVPMRHKFANPWTSKLAHFSHTSSSRGEGAHSGIKRWIRVRTADIHGVVARIKTATEMQSIALSTQLAAEKMKCKYVLGGSF